jgi:hypothetical protein
MRQASPETIVQFFAGLKTEGTTKEATPEQIVRWLMTAMYPKPEQWVAFLQQELAVKEREIERLRDEIERLKALIDPLKMNTLR